MNATPHASPSSGPALRVVSGGLDAVRSVVEMAQAATFEDDEHGGGGGGEPPSRRADLDDCPVKPLGHHDGTYYFLSPTGEMRTLKVRDFSANGLLSLFSGDMSWMVTNFQRMDKDGNPVNDFVVRGVVGHLIRICEAVGLFDPGLRLRGRGVWPGGAGEDGRPVCILHAGDRVARIAGGRMEWHRAGFREGRSVYPARPRVDVPDFEGAASAEDGKKIEQLLHLWRWQGDTDAMLLTGLIGAGLLGGFPDWRAHGMIAAAHGSGKSELCKLISGAMGPQAEGFNSFSEAGLRQVLADEARVAILDEAETDGGGAMQAVVGLIRRMSGGAGADIVRGSPSGEVKRYTVTGVAIMAGINPPQLTPQDRSRIIRFDLAKVTSDPEAAARVDAAVAWAQANSARLRARALLGAQRYAASCKVFRAALIGAGCDGRQADLFAAALAGRDLLVTDHPPDTDSIAELLAPLRPRINDLRAADAEDSDGQQCWHHLLGYIPDHWRSGARTTIGDLIANARSEAGFSGESDIALRTYGMRVAKLEGGDVALLVANKHPGLTRIFHGTAWAAGGHAGALKRLGEGVVAHDTPIRFAGPSLRCIRIPSDLLPDIDVGLGVTPLQRRDMDALRPEA